MSVIVTICEEPCPIHSDLVCCEKRGHELPHRTVLIGAKEGSRNRDKVVIEWQPARYDEQPWSTP